MKCIVCLGEVPEGEMNCPRCNEHMGQWLEMRDAGRQFIREGVAHAADGDMLRSALCLAKATVLLPDDPLALKVYGQVLARMRIDDQAHDYLKKAQMALAQTGKSEDPQIAAALLAIEQRKESPPQNDSTHGPAKPNTTSAPV